MTKAELESKHLAELHALAAEAGVSRYRMLARGELIERLSSDAPPAVGVSSERARASRTASPTAPKKPQAPESSTPAAPAAVSTAVAVERPKRRRRRRFRRRTKQGVHLQDLLLPPQRDRQTLVYAENRERCTAILRELASELVSAPKGPDPVVLLVDPGPEELADWKREAPAAEIVSAGQARHAADALAQAGNRARAGEDVILLIDSLTRLAEAYGDTDSAKEFFDAGRDLGGSGAGSLTVVAALERPPVG